MFRVLHTVQSLIFKVLYRKSRKTFERRRRDLNPRAATNDLLPFQGSPFNHLGTSAWLTSFSYSLVARPKNFRQRRGWDSNPRALADKRFSRPPRYDHFDTSPSAVLLFFRFVSLANQLVYNTKHSAKSQPLFLNFLKKVFRPQKSGHLRPQYPPEL